MRLSVLSFSNIVCLGPNFDFPVSLNRRPVEYTHALYRNESNERLAAIFKVSYSMISTYCQSKPQARDLRIVFSSCSSDSHIRSRQAHCAASNLCAASSKLITFQIALRYCGASQHLPMRPSLNTYVRLDILVLQVECVLPDVDPDNRDVRYETTTIREASCSMQRYTQSSGS